MMTEKLQWSTAEGVHPCTPTSASPGSETSTPPLWRPRVGFPRLLLPCPGGPKAPWRFLVGSRPCASSPGCGDVGTGERGATRLVGEAGAAETGRVDACLHSSDVSACQSNVSRG